MLVICLASLGLTLYYIVELVICFTGTLDTPRRPRHSYLCHIQQTDKSSILISSSGKGPYNTYWGSIASVKDKRALAPALETLHIYHDCVGGLTGGFLLQRMGGGTQHVPVLRTASTWHSDVGITCFSGLAPSPGFSQSHPLPPSASDSRVHIYLSHPLELRELRAQMSCTHAHLVTPAVLLRTDLGKWSAGFGYFTAALDSLPASSHLSFCHWHPMGRFLSIPLLWLCLPPFSHSLPWASCSGSSTGVAHSPWPHVPISLWTHSFHQHVAQA